MHTQPVLNSLRAALVNQAAVGGDDPTVDAAIAALTDALAPALRLAVLDIAQQAASEVSAQLTAHSVEVGVVDGDPVLRVRDRSDSADEPTDEEFDARITLRLPPSLKQLIEQSATGDGDSVNSWVVDALSKRAKQPAARGRNVTESFDL